MIFTLLKGLIYLTWIITHFWITSKYQHDNSSEYMELCKWKYMDIIFPNPLLPNVKDSMSGGPHGDYKAYKDIIVLLPLFLIEMLIAFQMKYKV